MKMDDFYFFTDPEAFIYDHYSKDPKQQLLARPVTYDEYKEMARLRKGFFTQNLIDTSHPKCVIDVEEGVLDIELKIPPGNVLSFYYDLFKSRGSKALREHNGFNLRDFVIIDGSGDTKKIHVELKYIGKYRLEMSVNDNQTPGTILYIFEYLINCKRPNFTTRPNPKNPRHEYGPGADALRIGMNPVTHKDGIIIAKEGIAEIKFQCTNTNLEFFHNLQMRDAKENLPLKDFTRHYVKNDEVTFYVKTPENGKYILQLHARIEGTNRFENICNYLIVSEVACTVLTPFPASLQGRVGSVLGAKKNLLKPVSHPDAIFTVPDEGAVDIEMTSMTQLYSANVQMKLYTDQKDIDCSDFAWSEIHDNAIRFQLRFPQAGMYDVNIFAKESSKEALAQNVWRYIIMVDQPLDECMPFPLAYSLWQNFFTIQSPTVQYLAQNISEDFSVIVPGASAVVLLGDTSACQQLDKEGSDLFRGTIETGSGDNLILAATFGTENEYSNLLEYKVRKSATNYI